LDKRRLIEITDPKDRIQHRLTQHRLAESLSRLTPAQYEVILLRFIEGLDNQEVAQLLGKSVSAVKSLQYRALIALRRALKHDED
jgi:RNA polymerase sigma-70 factor (ECF subfamily)